jgi:acetaldehyde dehydrogenase (acetylating)
VQDISFAEPAGAAVAARRAADAMAELDQAQTNRICEAMAAAAWEAAPRFADLAVTETGYGRYEDKLVKDRYCSWGIWSRIRDEPSAGVIRKNEHDWEYAEPVGVVMAICPVTNPTSTPIFKSISAAKGRNATIVAPHPRAVECGLEVARTLSAAAVAAGGPEQLVTCLSPVSLEATQQLMREPNVALILATGGSAMVRAAYASGKPAYGVGPGNVPVYVDRTLADPDAAVVSMLLSKLMDYGTSCSAEQSLVVHREVEPAYRRALEHHGIRFLSRADADRLAEVCVDPQGAVRPAAVGQSAQALARMAGITVDAGATLLAVELDRVARDEPFSQEILTSAIGYFVVPDADRGIEVCDQILAHGGRGHTAIIWADEDDPVVKRFAALPAGRILVNLPGTWGTAGILTSLDPSFMIGTGTWSGSITSDNITFRMMIQRKRLVAPIRTPEEVFASLERGPGSRDAIAAPSRNGATPYAGEPATAGLNVAARPYSAVPLTPEEEETVEAAVSEMLRQLTKGEA